MSAADVAVIGGGIIGISTAFELARQGAGRVVVFDKSLPGAGTTGGSAGVICLHDMGALYAVLTEIGFARIEWLRKEHGLSFRPWGSLWVVYEPGEWPPAPGNPYCARLGDGAGRPHETVLLERDEVLARYPWIKPEGVRGGIVQPNHGFVDTYEMVSLYSRLAKELNVEIRANEPVLQVRRDGDRIASLVTRRGEWRVGKVLNAAGPWGAKVAALAGTDVALTPQRIQVCLATGFDDGVDEAPLTSVPESTDGVGVWCRGELGGTLLFGQHWNETQPGRTVDPDSALRVNDEGYPAAVEATYRKYWCLPHSVFLNGWCCVYGTTADGFPILSRDERVANLYHALGLNGHGMTCHAGVALATTELMLRGGTSLSLRESLGSDASLDFSPLDASRFAKGEALDFRLDESRLPLLGVPS
ncbi:FAD-binding oxidoreductase [soil metagenome]